MNYIQKENMETIRAKFFAQVQEEYEAFKNRVMSGSMIELYERSLKVTFYKEVYKYLMDDMLSEEEYLEFCGEPVIAKLWDVFIVAELPRQTRDYLRQLVTLYRQNIARSNGEKE